MTSEYVTDASAVIAALVGKDAKSAAFREKIIGSQCHAPHLIDAEAGHGATKCPTSGVAWCRHDGRGSS